MQSWTAIYCLCEPVTPSPSPPPPDAEARSRTRYDTYCKKLNMVWSLWQVHIWTYRRVHRIVNCQQFILATEPCIKEFYLIIIILMNLYLADGPDSSENKPGLYILSWGHPFYCNSNSERKSSQLVKLNLSRCDGYLLLYKSSIVTVPQPEVNALIH